MKASTQPHPLCSGQRSDTIQRRFFLASHIPDVSLCTAVFGLVIYNNDIVLTKTKRGWEMPGGHIEPGETIHDALKREIQEETGYTINRGFLGGWREIELGEPIYNGDGTHKYPYPRGYIPHCVCFIDEGNQKQLADDAYDVGCFSLEQIKKLDMKNDIRDIMIAMYNRYIVQ